jgi:hypothetical protein
VFARKKYHDTVRKVTNMLQILLTVWTMNTYFTGKAVVARKHLYNVFSSNLASQIRNDLPWIIVVHRCGPTGSDTVGPVHKDHGDDWNVVFRFDI